MRTGSALFLLGVLLLCMQPELPSRHWLWFAPLVLLIVFPRRSIALPAWLAAGFLFALWRAAIILAPALDPAVEGQGQVVTGTVVSLPEQKGGVLRFNLRLGQVAATGLAPGTVVRLGWYYTAPAVLPGEHWQLRVRLKRPAGFMNAGGFDYEGWLFQRRIRATGYVVDGPGNERLAPAGALHVDLRRHQLRERIRRALPDDRYRSLVVALAIGDQSGMGGSTWSVLNRTGTNHLLAISGLHIGIVAGFAYWVMAGAWARLPGAALRVPAPWAGSIAAALAAGAYCALAGFSIPTQRSLVMICVGLGAWLLRPGGLGHALALALLAVLLLDPFAVLAAGFWLSFLAVAWIGWGMGCRLGPGSVWERWGRVQWVVSLGLMPVIAYWFGQVSLVGVVANLVAVPWVSFLTVPLVLASSALVGIAPAAGVMLLRAADGTLQLLWPFLVLLAERPPAAWAVGPTGVAAVVMAATGAALLLLPRGVPARWVGLAWLLPLWCPGSAMPVHGSVRLVLLDVGQGLAAVVQTARHTLLFDTGPSFGPDFTAGSAVVVPWLRQAGVRRLDMLVVSHGDADHAGGLADILAAVPAARILASAPARLRGAESCRAGQRWHWDGFAFEILHPVPGDGLTGNNASCVLRVAGLGHTLLLTGDIEREAEQNLLRRAGARLQASVLVVPHHGSRTSSTAAFVTAVGARHALHPAGYRNRFGFPKQDIMQRYQQHGATNLDTGRNGALEFHFDDTGVRHSTRRDSGRRFWHSRLR